MPKMYFLEEHVPQWLEKWKNGLGFMGKQGTESIHTSFNNIKQSYVNMPNILSQQTVPNHTAAQFAY